MPELERVLFVHAHPDDETISTGGALAILADRGAQVTVITCTRGERGEVIPAELQHLLSSADQLAAARESELANAMAILGVTDQRYLGASGARWGDREPRRYLDSGMAWGANGAEALDELDPRSLSAADLGEVASDIAAVITDVRPDVVVSYDAGGGYGHPDHVRAAAAARRAADVYDIPFFDIVVEVPDDATLTVDISSVFDRKRAALAAHRTQVVVSGTAFALSNGVSRPIGDSESFRRVHKVYPPDGVVFSDQLLGFKVLCALLAFVVGLSVGAILTIAHQASVSVAGVPVPVGLAAGIVTTAALLAGLRLVFGTRIVAASAALGLLVAVAVLALRSPGGSVLVPQTAAGIAWSVAPTLIAVIVLGWPQLRSRSRDTIEVSPEVKGSLLQ